MLCKIYYFKIYKFIISAANEQKFIWSRTVKKMLLSQKHICNVIYKTYSHINQLKLCEMASSEREKGLITQFRWSIHPGFFIIFKIYYRWNTSVSSFRERWHFHESVRRTIRLYNFTGFYHSNKKKSNAYAWKKQGIMV